jgi:hypothetical protein
MLVKFNSINFGEFSVKGQVADVVSGVECESKSCGCKNSPG